MADLQKGWGTFSIAGTELNLDDFVWPPDERPSAKLAHAGKLPAEAFPFPEVDLSLPDALLVPVLRSAASTWGFFRIFNHGVPQALLDSIVLNAFRFFELPSPDKLAIARMPPAPPGYTSMARSSTVRAWSEALQLMLGEDRIRKLLEQVPSFQDSQSFGAIATEYFNLVGALTKRLTTLLFCGLVADKNVVNSLLDSLDSSLLRINHYPACPVFDLTYGSPPHTDFGGLSILHQDDVGGLEVLKDGRWVALNPKKGCLIVNIGDIIQVVSNGLYQSVLHRSLVHKSRPRLSFVFFQHLPDDMLISPMPSLITKENPAKYRPFYMRELKLMFERALKAKHSPLEFFKEPR